MDSLSLLQGIFPTQGLNPGLLHCRQISYQLSHNGSRVHYAKCRVDEAQTGVKSAGRNISNLILNDTTLTEEEEELKSLLMKVKEESGKAGLKVNFQKTKIMASGPITLWQIYGETMETVTDYFLGLQNHCR